MVRGNTAAAPCQHRREREGLRAISKLSSSSLFSGSHINMFHNNQCKREASLTCRTICRDYCNNTAVHGFRYFFEENRSIQERTFWAFAVFICFAIALYLISKIWIKWETSPVIVTFADQPTPIWEIPFPAVTICPATKTKREKFNYTEALHRILDNNATEELKEGYHALSLICMSKNKLNGSFDGDMIDDSHIPYLREIAPSMEEVIMECWWHHQQIANCSDYFQEVMTEEGVCFSFNALGSLDLFTNDTVEAQGEWPPKFRASGWSVNDGYANDDPTVKSFYPRRSMFVGPFSGLRVILRSYDKDMDYVCRGCEQGFRVYLHNPAESALSTSQQMALPLNTSMLMLARPTVMKTSTGLLEYSPHRRRCFFAGERKLRHHKWYSQENCIYDCFANLILEKCGCSFLAPPRTGKHHRLCSFLSKCVMSTYGKLLNETATRIPFEGPIPEKCNCLPSCASLRYEVQGSTFDFPWTEQAHADRKKLPSGVSYSQLNIYFDSLQFISSRRSELYGHTDFLANFGGLLGLFTGFSIISLVEIGYYVSLRLWCDLRRRREDKRRRGRGGNDT